MKTFEEQIRALATETSNKQVEALLLQAAEIHAVSRKSCSYLGKQDGYRPCIGCKGNVRQKVFVCNHEHHESTTIVACKTCPDFKF